MINDNGTYKVGSIVHKQNSENGEISKLVLPGGKFSRQCVNSPIYFKSDVSLSCLLKNDESGCTRKYASFDQIDKIEIDSTGEESNFIKPTITCIDATGVEINPCRSSIFVVGVQCTDAITRSKYNIFTDGTTGLIATVEIELTLENIPIDSWIPQNNQIQFMRSGNSPTTISLSGNPGYQRDKPVRLGSLSGDEIFESNIFKMKLMTNNQ